MRAIILLILAAAAVQAGELDPAWQAFQAGRFPEGATMLRQLTDTYRRQSQIPEARRELLQLLARSENSDGPDAESVELLCLELAELYLSQSLPSLGLENLGRANRIARVRGRLEPERELRMAGLLLKATLYREALENLEYLTPRLVQEFGATDERSLAARKMLVAALKREGQTAKALALEESLAGPQHLHAGTVLHETEAGVYAAEWQNRPPAGAGVEIRRGERSVARAVVTPGGQLHVIGVVRLEPEDTLHYTPPPRQEPAQGPQISQSYRRAEANWNSLLASEKIQLVDNPAQQERLDRVGGRVAEAGRRNVPWHFFIVKDTQPNASCLGEGFVFVTTGLLKLGLSDDELAGVIGHEIAHGTEMHLDFQDVDESIRRQALRELQEAQALQARYAREYERESENSPNAEASYRSKMVTVYRRISSAQKKAGYLSGKQKFSSEFDQQQEIEADQIGMRYAVIAGYSADGLMSALEKIHNRRVTRFGYGYSADSRTHPPVARRLEVLRKVQASWGRR